MKVPRPQIHYICEQGIGKTITIRIGYMKKNFSTIEKKSCDQEIFLAIDQLATNCRCLGS
jgi:CTP:phosphocholine cytidylyltransferase-like protein